MANEVSVLQLTPSNVVEAELGDVASRALDAAEALIADNPSLVIACTATPPTASTSQSGAITEGPGGTAVTSSGTNNDPVQGVSQAGTEDSSNDCPPQCNEQNEDNGQSNSEDPNSLRSLKTRGSSLLSPSVAEYYEKSRKWVHKRASTIHLVFALLELVAFAFQSYQMHKMFSKNQAVLAQNSHRPCDVDFARLVDRIGELEDKLVDQEQKIWEQTNTYIQRCLEALKMDLNDPLCKSYLLKVGVAPPLMPGHFSSVTVKLERRGSQTDYPSVTSTLTTIANQPNTSQPFNFTLPHPTETQMENIPLAAIVTGFTLSIILVFLLYTKLLDFMSRSKRSILKADRLHNVSNEHSIGPALDIDNDEKFSTNTQPELLNISSKESSTTSGFQLRARESVLIHKQSAKHFWITAFKGKTSELLDLIESQGRNVNDVDSRYGTALTAACEAGHTATVNTLLKHGANVNITGGRLGSPLQAAAYSGKKELCELILREGADVNCTAGSMGTATSVAIERQNLAAVDLLLSRSETDVNATSGPFGSPLQAAVAQGLNSLVERLIVRGAVVNCDKGENGTALQIACSSNNRDLVKVLVANGADIEKTDDTKGTPLQVACRHGLTALSLDLIELKARVDLCDEAKRTPLHDAARLGNHELADALISTEKIDVNATDDDEWTPLHHAAVHGHTKVLNRLLKAGANVSVEDKFKAHPLFRAAGLGHTECVRLLVAAGSNVNATDTFGRTALHGPPEGDDVEVPQILLENGADVNIVGRDGKTALHEAANTGNLADVKLLLAQKGIKTNIQDNDQATPLQRAAEHCAPDFDNPEKSKHVRYEKIALLLLARSDVDVNARSGSTFQLACKSGNLLVVDAMLQAGVKVNQQGAQYGSAVGAAAHHGQIDVLRLLLENGANPNIEGGEYGTPLQAAAFNGHLHIARELIDAGANIDARGGRYGSVLNAAEAAKVQVMDFTEKNARQQLVNYLKSCGALEKPFPNKEADHRNDRWVLTPGGWGWLPAGRF